MCKTVTKEQCAKQKTETAKPKREKSIEDKITRTSKRRKTKPNPEAGFNDK